MTVIKQEDLIQSIADSLQYISYYHPLDYIEALGRAYFRSQHFEQARAEFEAVVERAPTNDYALFCLGRSLLQLGRAAEARKPLTLAATMNPKRHDYRIYRDRARKAA